MPDFQNYAVEVPKPGVISAEATRHGQIPARSDETQHERRNFRIFGPDETASNRLGDLFEATRTWVSETFSYDDHLLPMVG